MPSLYDANQTPALITIAQVPIVQRNAKRIRTMAHRWSV